jgi:NCS1 family nucleobase:cation symporter-1
VPIERRSIDFVPEHERHGRVIDQGPFWFLSNFHFFAIAIGFVGPSLGLSLGYTVLAGTLGILIGTTFQAFHASQGAELGLPQMIQSRAQFGYRGVILPLLATIVSLIGYNVVATVLVSEGCRDLWAVNRTAAAVGVSLVAATLAIWGYDWLHRVFRVLFWISLPLFSLLSIAIMLGKAGGNAPSPGVFHWAAFLTQLASAASFNITAAPYVSDYSRYLPTRTPRGLIIFHVFWGASLSAIWLIAMGAWLATHMGASDGLIALKLSGDAVMRGLGFVLAGVSIAALVATIGMNAYSSMLTLITTADSIKRMRPTRALRIAVIAGVTVVWITVAISFGGSAVTYVNAMLVIMLYFLMPWTAVNLIDYFLVRRGRYSVLDLFTPDGIYGAWGRRGLIAYAVGFAASIPFFVVPGVYTGPVAARLDGVDLGWLLSLAAASLAYIGLSRGFDMADEVPAIDASAASVTAAAPPQSAAEPHRHAATPAATRRSVHHPPRAAAARSADDR